MIAVCARMNNPVDLDHFMRYRKIKDRRKFSREDSRDHVHPLRFKRVYGKE